MICKCVHLNCAPGRGDEREKDDASNLYVSPAHNPSSALFRSFHIEVTIFESEVGGARLGWRAVLLLIDIVRTPIVIIINLAFHVSTVIDAVAKSCFTLQ